MTRDPNFPQLIRTLEDDGGLTRTQIARRCQVNKSTITRIAQGAQRPSYLTGSSIVGLFCRTVARTQR